MPTWLYGLGMLASSPYVCEVGFDTETGTSQDALIEQCMLNPLKDPSGSNEFLGFRV